MSLDGKAERAAIEARLKTALVGGRVYTSVPEETTLERDELGLFVRPYIVIGFGGFTPSMADRTIEGEAQQPQIMPVYVECWAADANAAMDTAGEVRKLLIGFQPDPDNATEMMLRSGGWFERRDATGRPSIYMEQVGLVTTLNQSIEAA